jgi:prolipoprotein diacylglyceryltransferase
METLFEYLRALVTLVTSLPLIFLGAIIIVWVRAFIGAKPNKSTSPLTDAEAFFYTSDVGDSHD